VASRIVEGIVRATLAITYLAATTIWVAVLATSPWLAVHGRAGQPGFLLSGAVYRVGAVICHQRADRSFHVSGAQLAVCARCTGLYAGAPFGAAVALVAARRRRWSLQALRVALFASAVPTLALWAAEWLGAIHPSNLARAAWALPLGAVVSGVVAVVLVARERDDAFTVSGVN
jgi:uncharacterized membrane protein